LQCRRLVTLTGYAERERLRLTGQLPDNFQIWICQCGQGGWETAYKRETHTGSLSRNPTAAAIASKNIQETAFGIGDLFIHIFHTTIPGFDLKVDILKPDAVIPLWPPPGGDIIWPPQQRLSVQDAFTVASLLEQLFRQPKVLWMPKPGGDA
jgi:hypothetical protein